MLAFGLLVCVYIYICLQSIGTTTTTPSSLTVSTSTSTITLSAIPSPLPSPSILDAAHSDLPSPSNVDATAAVSTALESWPLTSSSVVAASFLRTALEVILCSSAIYVCFIGYGLLQEKMYSTKYGPEGEKFDHSLFLVFVQCIGNALFAFIIAFFTGGIKATVPVHEYMGISFSYIGAMFASNYALAFMSYPAQALAKSCKLIPVMLMRILVLGKKYKIREYLQVVLITAGICLFMMAESSGKASKHGGSSSSTHKETSWFGLGLCCISLILDGYTGPTQESINHKYKPSMAQMMFWLNFWAILMVAIALLFTGQMWTGLSFCTRFPTFIPQALLFSLLSAMGQASILFTLLRFNSLIVVTITTTRKFFTILASVLLYGHMMNLSQWSG